MFHLGWWGRLPLQSKAKCIIVWVLWWNPQPPQMPCPLHQATYWLCLLTFVPHQMWFSDYCHRTMQLCKLDQWGSFGNLLQKRPAKHYWFLSAGGLRNSLHSQEGHIPNDFAVNMKYLRMPVSLIYVCVWRRAREREKDGQHVTGNLGQLVVFGHSWSQTNKVY